jgi:hypothetical protein
MARGVNNDWGGDVPPSLPDPIARQRFVDMGGGFVFTDGGIAHDVSEADIERLRIPPFAPSEMIQR